MMGGNRKHLRFPPFLSGTFATQIYAPTEIDICQAKRASCFQNVRNCTRCQVAEKATKHVPSGDAMQGFGGRGVDFRPKRHRASAERPLVFRGFRQSKSVQKQVENARNAIRTLQTATFLLKIKNSSLITKACVTTSYEITLTQRHYFVSKARKCL